MNTINFHKPKTLPHCIQLLKKESRARLKRLEANWPKYQLSRIILFDVYPRFRYRKYIFPTGLGFMLSCLSDT